MYLYRIWRVGNMLPVKTIPVPKRSTRHWGFSRHSKKMLEDSELPGGARDVVCVP